MGWDDALIVAGRHCHAAYILDTGSQKLRRIHTPLIEARVRVLGHRVAEQALLVVDGGVYVVIGAQTQGQCAELLMEVVAGTPVAKPRCGQVDVIAFAPAEIHDDLLSWRVEAVGHLPDKLLGAGVAMLQLRVVKIEHEPRRVAGARIAPHGFALCEVVGKGLIEAVDTHEAGLVALLLDGGNSLLQGHHMAPVLYRSQSHFYILEILVLHGLFLFWLRQ